MAGLRKHATKTIGVTEEMFLRAFESTPKLDIAQKKLENETSRCITIISNQHADWQQRVQAMTLFRSLVKSGLSQQDDFCTNTLKNLEIPFQNNICDLRSKVVHETCITTAFISCQVQQKFSRMAEMLLPSLIKLIPNSAEIISSSGLVTLRFIIKNTHSSRLIPIIKYHLSTSKSKDIHRALCEIAELVVTKWSPNVIERHIADFVEVLRLGICDSDKEARQYSRQAFNVFSEHFREQADRLFNSLDGQRQRMLSNLNHGGGSTLSINGYGSAASGLNTLGSGPASAIPTATSHHGPISSMIGLRATPNYANSPSSGYGQSSNTNLVSRLKSSIMGTNGTNTNISSAIPKTAPTYQYHRHLATASPSKIRSPTARSISAIDVEAQQRARARSVYLSSMYHRPRNIGSQLPQPTSPAAAAAAATAATTTAEVSNNGNSLSKAPAEVSNNGISLSKAATYLSSVISNNSIPDSQLVTTIKYFHTLIDKHPSDIIRQLLSDIMPPLAIGADNSAISVRKESVFAMVAIYAKVGLREMETYLTSLTMTQRKLLEVYIKKHDEETINS